MTGKRTRLSAVIAVLLPVLAPLVAVPSGTALAAPGLGTLAACVQQHRSLRAVLLIDESASLQSSDPADRRIGAAHAVVRGLAAVAMPRPDQEAVRVEVSVSGFGKDYDGGQWLQVPGDEEGLARRIADFADRADVKATDFAAALGGARASFAERAAQAGTDSCQALIWFTDGSYDVPGSDNDELKRELCEPGREVDQLRASRVAILTAALTEQVSDDDQAYLRRVTGTEPGCGDQARVEGWYAPAFSAEELVDAIIKLIPTANPPRPICGGEPRQCSFTLDPVLNSFFAVVHSGKPLTRLALRPPGGGPEFPLDKAGGREAVTVAGAELRWVWSGDAIALTGVLPAATADRWSGTWSVDSEPGDGLGGQIILFGNLAPELVEKPHFERGERWHVRARVKAAGGARGLAEFAPFSPELTVTVADGSDVRRATPIDTGSDEQRFVLDPPEEWHGAVVTVEVALSVRTSSGDDISPPAQRYEIPVSTPLIVDPVLTVPALRGDDPQTGFLTVTAPERAGCVWFGGVAFDGLPTDVEVRSTVDTGDVERPDGCIPVEPGQPRRLGITFETDGGWSGTANGRVALRVAEEGGEPEEVGVAFSIPLVVVRGGGWWVALIALAVMGLAPLALSTAFNRTVVARFPRRTELRAGTGRLRAAVDPGTGAVRLTAPDGSTEWPRAADADYLSGSAKKELRFGGIRLHAKVSLWPFARPRARISGGSGHVVATPEWGPAPRLDDLPLHLAGLVVARAPADRDPLAFDVEVLFVVDVRSRLTGRHLSDLRAAVLSAVTRLVPTSRIPTNDASS